MDSWYADLQNSGSAEGSLVKSGAVPARVRDEAVGPPRHRRHRPTSARPRRSRRAAPPACRTPRSWSWPSPAPAQARERRAAGDRSIRSACCWVRPDSSSGSPPTGSPPAGRSTTRSTRPAARVDWRTGVTAVVGALAFGLLPDPVRGRPARDRAVRRLVRDADRRPGDRPRPAPAAERPDPAGHPDRRCSTRRAARTRSSATSCCPP